MDNIHEEFVNCVRAIQEASDLEMSEALNRLNQHAVQHFDDENGWMLETDFPARECHINEHNAVLKSIREVMELQAEGNNQICRELAQNLAEWFPGHADYLDSALAHWMCKHRLGGKPVVFRPNLSRRLSPN
jgi:hemerythrin-like metal-binding protein